MDDRYVQARVHAYNADLERVDQLERLLGVLNFWAEQHSNRHNWERFRRLTTLSVMNRARQFWQDNGNMLYFSMYDYLGHWAVNQGVRWTRAQTDIFFQPIILFLVNWFSGYTQRRF